MQPTAAEVAVSKFETKIEHSNVAAVVQGNQPSAHGTMHLGGVTVHGTAIFAGATVPGAPAIGTPPVLKPTPNYPDAETRLLSERLAAAQTRKQRLQQHGTDTTEVMREILDLKRRLREGGQLKAGDSLGDSRYLLLDVLGRGGFATVWRAHDGIRNDVVAIKVLHSNLAGDRVRLDRFKRGARIMAELNHDGVVRILEPYGEDGGWHYFVMECLNGGDFRQAVLGAHLSQAQAIAIVAHVCDAVAEAHRRGFLHRDIKPANILLDVHGNPKLADFDLATATDTTGGTRTGALGTLVYTAPEIMDNSVDVDGRADVYSLGMTALFGLNGADLSASTLRGTSAFIDRMACANAVKSALKRSVEWQRDQRYACAGSFRDALRFATEPLRAPLGNTSQPSEDDSPALVTVESVSDLLKELDGLSGLSGLKRVIRGIIASTNANEARNSTNVGPGHYAFVGQPGTGKTTAAHLLAKALYATGLIESAGLTLVGRPQLIGQYVGQTAMKLKGVIDRARGGVLVIDEADHVFGPDESDLFGRDGLNTLLAQMDQHRSELCVVLCAYNIDRLVKSNPGLASRLSTIIMFDES